MAQLFVGVWPSAAARRALRAYPRPDDVDGWATERQWLVQVRPLGHVKDEATVEALVDVLRFELAGMPRPTARFGEVRGGSWLHVPVEGLEELREVVFEVTTPIVPVTHPGAKPWVVSIALRRTRSPRELVAPLSGSWRVGEVVLAVGTTAGGAGHGYETVEIVPLGR